MTDRERRQLEGIDAEARRVMRDYRGDGEPIGKRLAPLFLRRLEVPGERERIAAMLRPPGAVVHVSKPLAQVFLDFAAKVDRECGSPAFAVCGISIDSAIVKEKTPTGLSPGEGPNSVLDPSERPSARPSSALRKRPTT